MVVASTGFFDGIHIGHQAVIRTLLDYARKSDGQSLVVSFWPHPRVVLQKDAKDLRLLSSVEEKKSELLSMGVDKVEILPFNLEFASMDAESYLNYLKDRFGVGAIVLGYDNRFGSEQMTTMELVQLAQRNGILVKVVPPLDFDGLKVSSTCIRHALGRGEVELASKMLGRSYRLKGVVVSGKQIGRTIGYPTANLRLCDPLKCIPSVGVYLSRVWLEAESFWGMTNVDRSGLVETHLFNFERDIYGMELEVSFELRIRDEIKFSSFDELKKQLKMDELSAKKLIFAEYDHEKE